ncbi:MAG: tetratricopeptide repeat protein [Micavibrio sp.]
MAQTSMFRTIILLSASMAVLATAACSSTAAVTDAKNMSNPAAASRVDAILERAARDAKASGSKAETVVLLEQLYERNKDDPAIATGYAQALREDEQFTRARQIVQPYAQGKEAYPDAVTELAMIQLSLGQYQQAEQTAERAIELDPYSGRAFLALGTALDAQNRHDKAEAAFRQGIDKWKGDPAPIMNNLALNLASQNKLEQSIAMLEKAREISPHRMEIERNLRIIRTLQEGADDFTEKQKREKAEAEAAARAEAKEKADAEKAAREAAKEAAKKTEAQKKAAPAHNAKEPVKPEAKKQETKKQDGKKQAAPAKKKPVETPTNRRGSAQNFNTN